MRAVRGFLNRLESSLRGVVEKVVPGGLNVFSSGPLVNEALADIESRIQYIQTNIPVFPHNRITITFQPTTRQEADVLGAAASIDAISKLVHQKIRGCRVTGNPQVNVTVLPPGPPFPNGRRVAVDCQNEATQSRTAYLQVVEGAGTPERLILMDERIDIGRRDVDFPAVTDITFEVTETTVARKQAEVYWEPSAGSYVVADCSTRTGTKVQRRGQLIPVSPQGMRLLPGDEIVMGHARIRYDEQ